MYGYCGDTESHCGQGCQSGSCAGRPVVPGPGPVAAPANSSPGKFEVIGQSGVPVMHAALMPNGKVAFLDKVENYTQLKLPSGRYAFASEYDPITNTAVPLAYKTNAFCAGGIFLADGRLVSVGGNAPLTDVDPTVGDGFKTIRYLTRSPTNSGLDGQDWVDSATTLNSARWYPTAQIMPDGTVFVASGSVNGLDPNLPANNNPTYEMLDRNGVSNSADISMDILVKNQPYYMYPFVHLMRDGNLWVFVAKSSQTFNVASNTVVREFPEIPGDYRTYPNTGGSVMLPLSSADSYNPDIVICGGGPYQDITAPTDASCGRMQPLSGNPQWEMDSMPQGRGMVEGTLLLDGTVLWVNGANRGAQGFGEATDPTYTALLYNPSAPLGQRWMTDATSTIPRLYHSVALMLLDGTIMITGSNPVEQPILTPSAQNPFVTEFRVERYTPPYLMGEKANLRPTNVLLGSASGGTLSMLPGGSTFNLSFNLPNSNIKDIKIVLYYGGFVTHSVHMGHRMVYLDHTGFVSGQLTQSLSVVPPPNHNVAPPGNYVVHVVADGVPAVGQFVMVQ